MTKWLVLLAVMACSKSDHDKPAAADPWGTPTAADPWATPTTAPADPEPTPATSPDPVTPAPATAGASTLAGTYQCQTLRNGTLVNGMYQTAYVPSALGTFEIDADGTYRSASYSDKGSGRVRAEATTVTFEDGPYAGFIGQLGSTSSGARILTIAFTSDTRHWDALSSHLDLLYACAFGGLTATATLLAVNLAYVAHCARIQPAEIDRLTGRATASACRP